MRLNQRPLIGGGGGNELTSFSDDFNRTALGVNWAVGFHDVTEAGQYNPGPYINIVTASLSLGNSSGAGQAASIRIQPLLIGGAMGKNQFAEATIAANATALSAAGPGVAAFSDRSQPTVNGYYLGLGVSVCDLRRMGTAGVVITANFTAAAVGDKFRIAVVFNTPVGSNTVLTFKNNVLVNTTIDAAPSTSGLPCMYLGSCVPANSIRFTPFRCGVGLGS